MENASSVLEIYVMPACSGYETACRLADRIRAFGGAGIDVRLIDLSLPGALRPPVVFAVPTYLLDGRVLSLGNPEAGWLLAQLGLEADSVDVA